jgi:hypothetical protein
MKSHINKGTLLQGKSFTLDDGMLAQFDENLRTVKMNKGADPACR